MADATQLSPEDRDAMDEENAREIERLREGLAAAISEAQTKVLRAGQLIDMLRSDGVYDVEFEGHVGEDLVRLLINASTQLAGARAMAERVVGA